MEQRNIYISLLSAAPIAVAPNRASRLRTMSCIQCKVGRFAPAALISRSGQSGAVALISLSTCWFSRSSLIQSWNSRGDVQSLPFYSFIFALAILSLPSCSVDVSSFSRILTHTSLSSHLLQLQGFDHQVHEISNSPFNIT